MASANLSGNVLQQVFTSYGMLAMHFCQILVTDASHTVSVCAE
jgi:hypothetical protein